MPVFDAAQSPNFTVYQDIILELIIDLVRFAVYRGVAHPLNSSGSKATYEKEQDSVRATPELVCCMLNRLDSSKSDEWRNSFGKIYLKHRSPMHFLHLLELQSQRSRVNRLVWLCIFSTTPHGPEDLAYM